MNNCSFSLFLNILIFLIVLNTGFGVFLVAQLVTNLPAMQEAWVQSLGWEDPLEKGMATHSNILAWRIPWTVACQVPLSMRFSRQEFWSG